MPEFAFRGKSLEELKAMSVEEFKSLVPAKERRAIKRGFTEIQNKFLEKIVQNPKKFHRTKSRGLVIIPQLIGVKLGVYNGHEYIPIEIKPPMLGHRLGEFVLTRKIVKHSAPGFGATRSSKYIPLK